MASCLRVRNLRPADFNACWSISTLANRFESGEVSQLRAAWAYLLPRDEMRGAIVEGTSKGSGPRVLAFGASVFVSDEWLLDLRRRPRPFALNRLLLEAGKPQSPILNRQEIGLYNAQGGLNLVCPHRGELAPPYRLDTSSPGLQETIALLIKALVAAFQDAHRGFQLREMLNEAHGPEERHWSLQGGNWSVRDEYQDFYATSPEMFPEAASHPYLIGATEQETAVNSALWCMFQTVPPALGFSNRQKQIFTRALGGGSNRTIAEQLGIGIESVRNAFRAGYDRVSSHPVFLHEFDKRQKRRSFLELIRAHIQETRPWAATPAIKRNAAPVFAARY